MDSGVKERKRGGLNDRFVRYSAGAKACHSSVFCAFDLILIRGGGGLKSFAPFSASSLAKIPLHTPLIERPASSGGAVRLCSRRAREPFAARKPPVPARLVTSCNF